MENRNIKQFTNHNAICKSLLVKANPPGKNLIYKSLVRIQRFPPSHVRVTATKLVLPVETTRILDNIFERVILDTESLAVQNCDVRQKVKQLRWALQFTSFLFVCLLLWRHVTDCNIARESWSRAKSFQWEEKVEIKFGDMKAAWFCRAKCYRWRNFSEKEFQKSIHSVCLSLF